MTTRGVSLRELARRAHCDPSYLSRVLNGRQPVTPQLAGSVDSALGAGGELARIAAAPVRAGRRDAGSGGAVTGADTEAVREITRAVRGLDNRFGGAHAHTLAAGYLDSTVIPMLRAGSYTEDVGQELFGLAAQLAHLAAWTAYDMDDSRRAQRYFAKALELAAAAGDQAFAGEILAARSHHAIHRGEPDRAAELARASQQAARKTGTDALLAEACALEAGSRALLGDAKGCAASLAASERAFQRSREGGMPEWLAYFGEGYLAARFAHCLRDLGEWEEARRHAVHATSMSAGLARTRAFNTAMLASTYISTDLDQACSTGMEAVDLAAALQSGRAVRYIADLQRRVRRQHGNEPRVKAFTDYVSERLRGI
jgi:hypothetical protein